MEWILPLVPSQLWHVHEMVKFLPRVLGAKQKVHNFPPLTFSSEPIAKSLHCVFS